MNPSVHTLAKFMISLLSERQKRVIRHRYQINPRGEKRRYSRLASDLQVAEPTLMSDRRAALLIFRFPLFDPVWEALGLSETSGPSETPGFSEDSANG